MEQSLKFPTSNDKAAPLRLGSKAGTLAGLQGALYSAKVKTLVRFTVESWKINPVEILTEIAKSILDEKLIVRSSCAAEDGEGSSHAGEFLSVADVASGDRRQLSQAIEKVIDSYGLQNAADENEVLVQGQIQDLAMIGVAMSIDHSTNAPYYVINYHDRDPRPESVTSGASSESKTFIHFRLALSHPKSEPMQRVIALLNELELRFNHRRLDIEFAIDSADTLYLLQVRPIASRLEAAIDESIIRVAIEKIRKKVHKLNAPHPYLLGENTVLGMMPDWNPAEIIGAKPRMLALSTYRELVTDAIWAYQRHNYGYRDLRGFPLIRTLMGIPYVDVRLSFNSFIPRGIDDPTASRLVNYYLDALRSSPCKHDKVEFDIVFSCFSLNLPQRLAALSEHGFSAKEVGQISKALHSLTVDIIDPSRGLYQKDISKIRELERRQLLIQQSELPVLDAIYWLIEDCKRYGTLPFAGLARSAFIAVQMLRSMVETGILSEQELGLFMTSLKTPASALQADFQALRQKRLSQTEFLHRYGHLRPGTYDILSKRYDENFDVYFQIDNLNPVSDSAEDLNRASFSLSDQQLAQIDSKLQEHQLMINASSLMDFIRTAIEGREHAKFVFSKTISDLFVHLERFGSRFGFSREELSHLDLQVPLSYYAELDSEDIPNALESSIARNKRSYRVTGSLLLPSVLCSADDVDSFHLADSEPNYISLNRVQGVIVTEHELNHGDLQNKIVMIKSADPGYDWLFAQGIAGLITMYGGTNSHMAIRAGEQNLPAVIGAGEQLFRLWQTAQRVEIDCQNKLVTILSQRSRKTC